MNRLNPTVRNGSADHGSVLDAELEGFPKSLLFRLESGNGLRYHCNFDSMETRADWFQSGPRRSGFFFTVDFVNPWRWLTLKCVRISFAQLRVVRFIFDDSFGLRAESRA